MRVSRCLAMTVLELLLYKLAKVASVQFPGILTRIADLGTTDLLTLVSDHYQQLALYGSCLSTYSHCQKAPPTPLNGGLPITGITCRSWSSTLAQKASNFVVVYACQ